jgi:DNA-binding NarL/FixJ family response regulator
MGSPFTQRQIDILKKREPDNKKIAERLFVSEKSIRRKTTIKGLPGAPKKK